MNYVWKVQIPHPAEQMEQELAWSVVKNDGHRGPVKFPSQVPHKQCQLMWDGTPGKLTKMRRIPKSVYNHGFKKCQCTPQCTYFQ